MIPLTPTCPEVDVVDALFLIKICRATLHTMWDNETLDAEDQWRDFNDHWLELWNWTYLITTKSKYSFNNSFEVTMNITII